MTFLLPPGIKGLKELQYIKANGLVSCWGFFDAHKFLVLAKTWLKLKLLWFECKDELMFVKRIIDPLSGNPTKCSNTLKQFVGNSIRRQQPANCLSVFDHFVGLVLKGLSLHICIGKLRWAEGYLIYFICEWYFIY